MASVIWYLFHSGLLIAGLIMCCLSLVEFTTRRILNLETESSHDNSADTGPTTVYTGTTTEALLHGGTIAFGLIFFLGGGVMSIYAGGAFCAKCFEEDKSDSTNSNNNDSKRKDALPDWFLTKKLDCNNTLLENLPNGWHIVEIPNEKAAIIAAEVESLFHDTWQYTERIGRDAANLKHDSLKIRAVCMVHNSKHINSYQRNIERFKVHGLQKPRGRLTRLNSVKGQAEPLTWSSSLGAALYEMDTSLPNTCSSINEIYLFHGTKTGNVKGILEEGFSLEKSSIGLYGKALYFAESSEKSDQYTDCTHNRRNESLCMLLVRVALGRIYVHKTSSGNFQLDELPCTKKHCFTPGCAVHSEKFNSAVAGLDKRFREFLLFDSDQCYPHVLVFYDRQDQTNRGNSSKDCNIPCYIVGPKAEVQYFKHRNNHITTPDNIHWENEAESNSKLSGSLNPAYDGSFEMTAMQTSDSDQSDFESEPDMDNDRATLTTFNRNHTEREHKLNHIAALLKQIPLSKCSSDQDDDTLEDEKTKLFKIKKDLKKTHVKIDRLVESVNRSYILSGSISESTGEKIQDEVAYFIDTFDAFNATFKIWRNSHKNCRTHME